MKIFLQGMKSRKNDYLLFYVPLQICLVLIFSMYEFVFSTNDLLSSFKAITGTVENMSSNLFVVLISIPLLITTLVILNISTNYYLGIRSEEFYTYQVLGIKKRAIYKQFVYEGLILYMMTAIIAVIGGHLITAQGIDIINSTKMTIYPLQQLEAPSLSSLISFITASLIIYSFITFKSINFIRNNGILSLKNAKTKSEISSIDQVKSTYKIGLLFNVVLSFGIAYYILHNQYGRLSILEGIIVGIGIFIAIRSFYEFLASGFFELLPNSLKYRKLAIVSLSQISYKIQSSINFLSGITIMLFLSLSLLIGALYFNGIMNFTYRPETAIIEKNYDYIDVYCSNQNRKIETLPGYNFEEISGIEGNYTIVDASQLEDAGCQNKSPAKQSVVLYKTSIESDKIKITDESGNRSPLTRTVEYDQANAKLFDEVEDDAVLSVSHADFEHLNSVSNIDAMLDQIQSEYPAVAVDEVKLYSNPSIESKAKDINYLSYSDFKKLNAIRNFESVDQNELPTHLYLFANDRDTEFKNKANQSTIDMTSARSLDIDYSNLVVVADCDLTPENGFKLKDDSYFISSDNLQQTTEISNQLATQVAGINQRIQVNQSLNQSGLKLQVYFVFSVLYLAAVVFVLAISLLSLYLISDARANKEKYKTLQNIGYSKAEIIKIAKIQNLIYFLVTALIVLLLFLAFVSIFTAIISNDITIEILLTSHSLKMTTITIAIGGFVLIYLGMVAIVGKLYKTIISQVS